MTIEAVAVLGAAMLSFGCAWAIENALRRAILRSMARAVAQREVMVNESAVNRMRVGGM